MLWRKALHDQQVNRPFQKLRSNILLFLQLLFLLLAILALAQPYLADGIVDRGVHTVILLDTSASMGIKNDEGVSRLTDAKEIATKIINEISTSDEIAIISFDDSVRTICSFTSSVSLLSSRLDAVSPRASGSKIRSALSAAYALAASQSKGRVIILSDGNVRDASKTVAIPDGITTQFHLTGSNAKNAGIVAMDIRPIDDPDLGISYEVFCRVRNSSSEAISRTIILSMDGSPVHATKINIEPNADKGYVFGPFLWQPTMLKIKIQELDALEYDNEVYAVVGPRRDLRVLLVGETNLFLKHAIKGLPHTQIRSISPDDCIDGFSPTLYECDVAVIDTDLSITLGKGAYLALGVELKGCPLVFSDLKKDVRILDWDTSHPACRYVNFDELWINESPVLTGNNTASVILESVKGALIMENRTSGENGIHAIVVAFDMYRSNWPLQLSFPLFLANSIEYLAGNTARHATTHYLTNDTIHIKGKANEQVVVKSPSGITHNIIFDSDGNSMIGETAEVGLYSLTYKNGTTKKIACNLLRENESNCYLFEQHEWGSKKDSKAQDIVIPQSIWKWFLLAALILLLGEWLVHHRRVGM